MGRIVVSLSIPDKKRYLWDAAKYLAQREKTSTSQILLKAFEEYLKHHKEGNPQLQLIPKTPPYINPPAQQAKMWIHELEDLIRANSGKPLTWFKAILRMQTGLRYETVRGYFQVLEDLGKIRVIASRVYHKEKLPER